MFDILPARRLNEPSSPLFQGISSVTAKGAHGNFIEELLVLTVVALQPCALQGKGTQHLHPLGGSSERPPRQIREKFGQEFSVLGGCWAQRPATPPTLKHSLVGVPAPPPSRPSQAGFGLTRAPFEGWGGRASTKGARTLFSICHRPGFCRSAAERCGGSVCRGGGG